MSLLFSLPQKPCPYKFSFKNHHFLASKSLLNSQFLIFLGILRVLPKWLWRHNCQVLDLFLILMSLLFSLSQKPCPCQFWFKTQHFLASNTLFRSKFCVFWGILGFFPKWLCINNCPKLYISEIPKSPLFLLPQKTFPYQFWFKTHHFLASNSLFNRKFCTFWDILGVFPNWLWRNNCSELHIFRILMSPSFFLVQKPSPYQFSFKTHNFLATNRLFNSQFWYFGSILGVFPDHYDVIIVQNLIFLVGNHPIVKSESIIQTQNVLNNFKH